jgi:hypothetical protein
VTVVDVGLLMMIESVVVAASARAPNSATDKSTNSPGILFISKFLSLIGARPSSGSERGYASPPRLVTDLRRSGLPTLRRDLARGRVEENSLDAELVESDERTPRVALRHGARDG